MLDKSFVAMWLTPSSLYHCPFFFPTEKTTTWYLPHSPPTRDCKQTTFFFFHCRNLALEGPQDFGELVTEAWELCSAVRQSLRQECTNQDLHTQTHTQNTMLVTNRKAVAERKYSSGWRVQRSLHLPVCTSVCLWATVYQCACVWVY